MKSFFRSFMIALAAVIIASCATAAYAANDKKSKSEVIVYHLNPGMSCLSCENKIKSNMRFEKGIQDIKTSLADQTVTIKFNPRKTTSEAIVKALAKLGYGTTPSGAAPSGEQLPSNCEKK